MMEPDTHLSERLNRERSSSAARNQRMRRIGKVFEGILFLIFISPALFITLTFDAVPMFGGRGNNPPTTLLFSSGGYRLGLLGYTCLVLAAIIRIIDGIDSRARFRYGRLVILIGTIGVLFLVLAAVVEALGL